MKGEYMGFFSRFKGQMRKENTCEDCSNFRPKTKNYDFAGGEYMNIYGGSCLIYGEFKTFQSSNFNNKTIDEAEAYGTMLVEKAKDCKDFKNKWSFE